MVEMSIIRNKIYMCLCLSLSLTPGYKRSLTMEERESSGFMDTLWDGMKW